MPWFNKKSNIKIDKDDQMQLTLKCMQSQQSNEPIFDIASCKAPYVPEQTFTYCKLLKKTTLNMSNNTLTSFEGGGSISDLNTIETLLINNNKFSSLPSELGYLNSLIKLDASENDLATLPDSFEKLINLEEINLCSNKFKTIPDCLFKLPKLSSLLMEHNPIKKVHTDLNMLQNSLVKITLSTTNLKEPFLTALDSGGTDSLLKLVCEKAGVDYIGLVDKSPVEAKTFCESEKYIDPSEDTEYNAVMENYMKKKKEAMAKQLMMEQEVDKLHADQVDLIMKKNLVSKKELTEYLSKFDESPDDYNAIKDEQHILKVALERQMLQAQDDEMGAYLANTCDKENLVKSMANQQDDLDSVIETLVKSKEREKQSLLGDLMSGEKQTELVMQEVVDAASNKNQELVSLLQEQDSQISELVSTAAGAAATVRENEVRLRN